MGEHQASGAFGEMKDEIENVIETIFSDADFGRGYCELLLQVDIYISRSVFALEPEVRFMKK